jgi:hypothetical protein
MKKILASFFFLTQFAAFAQVVGTPYIIIPFPPTTSNGTAIVSAYNCSTAPTGTMIAGEAASAVTQTITATVTSVGTYNISAIANGVTFNATGTFAGTGSQNILLTALGTPTATGSHTFTLNTTPNCSFSRVTIGIVTSTTGKIWLDRNLGATQVATSSTDALSYGDLYQWGRLADGHQIRTSGTTSALSSKDVPGNANFILSSSDWRSSQNINLWQGLSGTNNPCPSGYRLPTNVELDAERNSWSINNASGAFASPLKLTVSGTRGNIDGSLNNVGAFGSYWSSSVSTTISSNMYFGSSTAGMDNNFRATGNSVRCIKGDVTSGGTAVVSAYTCSTASAGTMVASDVVSGVTQTITATVTTVGTYNISAVANGVTFNATGTFTGTGAQNIVLTANGTPTAAGSHTFTLNTSPNCNFSRVTSDVVTSTTGKIWLDRNLGATQVATSSTDAAAYGDLYQWGRLADGHQIRTSGTTSTLSSTDVPGNANFILAPNTPFDWRSGQNINLWQGLSGTNNPCPIGFRLPTEVELNAERTSWGSNNNTNGAFESPLKLTIAGRRFVSTGSLGNVGTDGGYSSSTVSGSDSRILYFASSNAFLSTNRRGDGYSVRCIKGDVTSGGTAIVSAYTCSTASAGTMTAGVAVSGVTQTITATVTTVGTYNISAIANGVTFAASGTFAGTGAQNIVLTATGTPTAAGSNSFTLNTTPNCSFSRIALAPLPVNITLSAISPYFVASVYDQDYLPYTAPTAAASLTTPQAANGTNETPTLNTQGILTTGGVTLKIPYTVVTATVSLPGFTQTINVPASFTEDGIARDVTFSYGAASLGVGSGTINVTLQAVGGTLNAKKLDLQTGIGNDNLGWLLAQFSYALNSSGGSANFQFRNIALIPDRNIADANHVMFYMPVIGADGRTWLNNNLGADYANTAKSGIFSPSSQASSATDQNAYGSLFQWGRYSDGHELINHTLGTLSAFTVGTSTSTTPGANFLSGSGNWYTGTSPTPASLWQGVNGTNNPCPIGWRLPTFTELTSWTSAAGINGRVSAASSTLKFSVPGFRSNSTANRARVGDQGLYFSSSNGGNPSVIFLGDIYTTQTVPPAFGLPVRCIKD